MSARPNRRNRKSRRNHPAEFEMLEQRRLLTTLYGGQSLAYTDANDNDVMIIMGGRIQAEFTFAHVNDSSPTYPRLGDHVPGFLPDDADIRGADLFNIYVHYAEEDSYIVIAQVGDTDDGEGGEGGEGGPLTPYEGSIGSLSVGITMDGEPVTIDAPGGTGAVLLGARTLDIEATDEIDESDRPVLWAGVDPAGRGLLPPQPGNVLRAGLTVANGHSLGAFLLGGTFTGSANFTGSIGDFYAGWLISGNPTGGDASPGNFFVNGDARNIFSMGSIGMGESADPGDGGDDEGEEGNIGPSYRTGFDLQVRGSLGQLRSGGSFVGNVDVINALGGPFFNRVQREVEQKSGGWSNGRLGGHPMVDNDTFETPQYLGTLTDNFFGSQKGIRLVGSVEGGSSVDAGDVVDYYAVSLLAGQRVTVQVVGLDGVHPGVGVFDPDGRLITSDWNDVDSAATLGQQFEIVADRPGAYRFAVGNFSPSASDEGGGGEGGQIVFGGIGDYSLRIGGAGDIGLGGIALEGDMFATGDRATVLLRRGDLGAMATGGSVLTQALHTIHVPFGSVRMVQAQEGIGAIMMLGGVSAGLELNVPYGHVGLIQSFGDVLYIANENARTIGGSYQVVDTAGTFQAGFAPLMTQTTAQRAEARGLIAKGRIGVIRAGDMATLTPSYIEANADANIDPRFGPVTDGGRDGTIDLIDVQGDIGTLMSGGPGIVTNFGGNVRYMLAGGDVYTDRAFGSGLVGTTLLLQDELVVVDDGGGRINVTGPRARNPRFGLVDEDGIPEPRFLGKPPAVTYRAYPIRGSGGSVLMDISSDRTLQITNLATHAGSQLATPVQIGRISMTGSAGGSLVPSIDPLTGLETGLLEWQVPPGGLPMELNIRGPAPVDVMHVQAQVIDVISNVTGGEIAKVTANQIHNLFSRDIGLARSTTGAAVEPGVVLFNTFPFQGQRLGVSATDIGNVAASGAIGAVSASGTINAIVANQDRVDFSPAEFEGIVGPIFAGGEIGYVEIGEGLGSSGKGGFAQGGLYATGQIRYVTNNNGNGSIWGNIVSNTKIAQIVLNNGSIIDANIMVVEDLAMSSDVPLVAESVLMDLGADTAENPIYEIVNVEVNGAGGVIGSVLAAADFGNLTVNSGFGLLNSAIMSTGDGRINRIIVDGYGIRDSYIGGGSIVSELNARGTGAAVNPAAFTRDVRGTAIRGTGFDPRSGFRANRLNDLYKFFDVTPAQPHRENHTNSGIIEGSVVIGQRELSAVYANRLRYSIFNFGNKIDRIQTRSAINGLSLTTGELVNFHSGSSVLNFEGTVAGPVSQFVVMGDFDANSSLIATGPSGRIGTFRTNRDLAGNVSTTGYINWLIVGRDVAATGNVAADAIFNRQIGGQVLGTITIF